MQVVELNPLKFKTLASLDPVFLQDIRNQENLYGQDTIYVWKSSIQTSKYSSEDSFNIYFDLPSYNDPEKLTFLQKIFCQSVSNFINESVLFSKVRKEVYEEDGIIKLINLADPIKPHELCYVEKQMKLYSSFLFFGFSFDSKSKTLIFFNQDALEAALSNGIIRFRNELVRIKNDAYRSIS